MAFLAGGSCRRVMALSKQKDTCQQQYRGISTGNDTGPTTALGGGAGSGSGNTIGVEQQTRQQTTHAISNPVLADIEKRWDEMPPQEQANLWMSLRDRQKVDWHDLTLNEKKAGMFVFNY